jgi:hypothetical protein
MIAENEVSESEYNGRGLSSPAILCTALCRGYAVKVASLDREINCF